MEKDFKNDFYLLEQDYFNLKSELFEELDDYTYFNGGKTKNGEFSMCIGVSEKQIRDSFEKFIKKLELLNENIYKENI